MCLCAPQTERNVPSPPPDYHDGSWGRPPALPPFAGWPAVLALQGPFVLLPCLPADPLEGAQEELRSNPRVLCLLRHSAFRGVSFWHSGSPFFIIIVLIFKKNWLAWFETSKHSFESKLEGPQGIVLPRKLSSIFQAGTTVSKKTSELLLTASELLKLKELGQDKSRQQVKTRVGSSILDIWVNASKFYDFNTIYEQFKATLAISGHFSSISVTIICLFCGPLWTVSNHFRLFFWPFFGSLCTFATIFARFGALCGCACQL